jgi:hypothetical protein
MDRSITLTCVLAWLVTGRRSILVHKGMSGRLELQLAMLHRSIQMNMILYSCRTHIYLFIFTFRFEFLIIFFLKIKLFKEITLRVLCYSCVTQ